MNRTIALIAFLLALGGCEKNAETSAAGAAGAEVLPGSVSDAMLDTDQSRAQAPLDAAKPAVKARLTKGETPVTEGGVPPAEDTPVASATPASRPATAPGASAAPKPSTR